MTKIKPFKVNEYITLKLEGGSTQIYVKDELFSQCKYLLIHIPTNRVSDYDRIDSIDEAVEEYNNNGGSHYTSCKIPPTTEFWGHCSNIQAWAEHNYNTCLIHSNLAFPLLRKLTEVGDPVAKNVFKEEIALRFESGAPTVCKFLLAEGYINHLDTNELHSLIFTEQDEIKESFCNCEGDNQKMDIIHNILKKLTDKGDSVARDVLRKHILEGINSKNKRKIDFFIRKHFLDYLERDELLSLLKNEISSTFGIKKMIVYLIEHHPKSLKKEDIFRLLKIPKDELLVITEIEKKLKVKFEFVDEINWKSDLVFTIKNNKINGIGIYSCGLSTLPESIKNLDCLEELELYGNRLSRLPESIGSLTSLNKLDLTGNQLTSLPKSIGTLVSLKTLLLSRNKISSLPESFENLTSLESLYMFPNPLDTKAKSIINKLKDNAPNLKTDAALVFIHI